MPVPVPCLRPLAAAWFSSVIRGESNNSFLEGLKRTVSGQDCRECHRRRSSLARTPPPAREEEAPPARHVPAPALSRRSDADAGTASHRCFRSRCVLQSEPIDRHHAGGGVLWATRYPGGSPCGTACRGESWGPSAVGTAAKALLGSAARSGCRLPECFH